MKTALIILDGWGIGNADGNNAIEVAQTPYVDSLNAQTLTPRSARTGNTWACLTAKWATVKWGT